MSKQVAITTGTSTGLGIAIAVQLAANGYKSYATMRNTKKKGALLKAAADAGVTVDVLQLDVQDAVSIEACIAEVLEREGQLDLLINNAGVGFIKPAEHATDEEIEWVMDVNLKGVIRCTRAVLPHMRERRSGHIVNVTSVGGLVGQPFNELYCAAKFAVEGFTEALATYVGPAFNIHFSTIQPGGIQSEFANSVLKQLQESGGLPQDEYQPILQQYIGGAGEHCAEDIYQTAGQVAEKVLACVLSEQPPLRSRTSQWGERFCSLKTQADPTGNLLVKQVHEELL